MSLGISRRRVQRLGGSSLIITLPKDWARKAGIAIGDEVIVVDEGNHLKIVPANSKQVKTIAALNLKLTNYLKSLDPKDIARCAFITGHDRLIIELPRHGQINDKEFLEKIEESDYVLEAVNVLNIIEAQLLSSKESNRKFIKLISSLLFNVMESAVEGNASWQDLQKDLDKVEMIVDLLARDAFRNKVLSCSGEKMNPMAIGILYAVVRNARRLVEELRRARRDEAKEIVDVVGKVLMLTASGAANVSGKRLLEAINEAGKGVKILERKNSRVAGLALSLIDSLVETARAMLCLTLSIDH